MSPIVARSAGICLAALLILLAAASPASGACTMSVSGSKSISNPNGIFVLNNIAYVASTANHGKLFITPVNPIGSATGYDVTDQAWDVSVSESTAYMTEGSSGVEVVNAANGAHLGWCTNWDSSLFAIGIYISGNYAYVGAAGGTTGGSLVVLSLATPNSPEVVNTISCGSMNSGGGGLCVTDGKIYLATDDTIDVFSISNPEEPFPDSPLPIAGAYDVHVFGGKIYVVAPSSSPSVTVRDLSSPTVVQDCYNAGSPYAIQFYNGKIYIVGPDNGMEELSVGSVSGSLTVTLDAVPNDAQDFSFSGADLGSFTLDDDSGADGTYSNAKTFSSLAAGYYTFRQTVPSGWLLSSITASDESKVTYSGDGTSWHSGFVAGDTWAKASVQAGGSLTVNYQDTRVYSISGHVIYDLDGSGTRNNQEGYVPDGWVMELYKDGSFKAQTTTANGAYAFSNLLYGNYEVRSILQSGWVNTLPANGIRSYSSLSTDQNNQDFGARGSQSIAGMKFHDLDGDGAKGVGEPGLTGWTITLRKDGTVIASILTAAGGAYSFAGLAPGSYTVEETVQSGWAQSYPASPGTYAVTLVAGVAGPTDIDFGNFQTAGFSGMKFEDSNGNGAKDGGEPGVVGWTIKLKKGATEVASTQTTTGGAYSFTGIAPGSYIVEETVQSGWTQSYPASPGTYAMTLTSGVAGPTNVDFGNWRATGFSGMKFEDLNGNGAKDSGEPGLVDWTIKLKKGVTEIANTKTVAGGAYSFAGIAPGSYTVEETVQGGWTQSYPASPGTNAVTLVSGVAGPTNVDFGNWRTTGFSGMKFEDLDGDGSKDAAEPGLEGWTIRLMKGATEVASTQTVAGGTYSFSGIAPGSYTVEEIAQSGWAQSYPASPGPQTVTLVSGVAGPTDIDFGNVRTTGFSGMKFEDLNGNGVKDAGELGLEGWTIRLKKGATEVASTQTAADGAYSFTDIAPGSYTVEETVQGGWTQSYPASPGTYAVTLVSGVAGPTNIDFGNFQATGFSGMKFEDLNGNGVKDSGELGLVGWTIRLMKGATEVASTQTTAGGAYSFTGIAPGSYAVEETVQSGWTRSYPASPGTYAVTLVSGVAGPTNIDFGNWHATGFSGMKFEDLNGNGARDGGEPGVVDWTIKLKKGATEVASTQTTAGGAYSFTGIAPGSYTVEEIVQSGWTQSYPASPGTQTVTLVSGVAGPTNVDFGNWRATGFSGMKFEDSNGNGAKDNGEPGLEGWTIRLMKDGAEIAGTQTDANGAYSFAGITPGSYTVEEESQSGWAQSYPVSPVSQAVTLVSGVAGPNDIDFGNVRTTGFSGMKFEDLNGNGVKDAGELGLEGWTINLKKDGAEIASTQTAADGAYSFTDIAPGSYTVEETVQGGWTQSYPASPGTYAVTLVSGVAGPTDIDFGNWKATGFSGMKFEDLNGNGAKDAGEPGVVDWTIKLKKGATEVASTKTVAGGAYSFSGIAPGSYTVEETVQSGWTRSYPASPGTYAVTLVSGVDGPTNIDFGNWRATGFSGMKFEDLNGNGARDGGEPGVVDWTIKLKKGATEVASTQTGAGGAYSFSGIAPGSYTVEEIVQSGWTQSYPASPGTQTVTLVSGVAGPTNIDFGNWRATGFSGMKFEDLDGNGAKDGGEPGLESWTIKLKKDGVEIASTQTVAGGAYSFSGIAPGSYTVEEIAQSGWAQSYPASPGTYAITLVSGVAGPNDIDFGNFQSIGFSGMKFEDLNGNGAKDSGEPGLEGWTIRLMKGTTEVASTQTTAGGAYSFSSISPGSYTVEETIQGGWTQSYPASPGTYAITLVSGVAGPNDIDFGNFQSIGFSGMKFEDLNGNGAKDSGEPGLEGWTIRLMKGTTEVASTQTTAGGAYSFSSIAPGSYTVEETVQGGWTQSHPASPGTYAITLVSGVAGPTNIDFGNWRTTGFSGMKFEDLNGNGARDGGEPGLVDWTIKLKKGATEVASTQTGAGGAYSFTGIAPGSYTVEEIVQSGWTQSYPASPGMQTVTLVSGVAGPTNIDFGNWRTTGFSGIKFDDLDGNGAKDNGEPGLEGWTIKLKKGETEIASTETAAGGAYSFDGISPGSYTVDEVAQDGWAQTYPTAPGTHTINLVSGVAGPTDINFGNRGALSISGMKFHDRNANGHKEADEPPISGWEIQLKDDSDNLLQTATTSSEPGREGIYEFVNLRPGTYRVYEVQKTGWVRTVPQQEHYTVTLTNSHSRGNIFGNNQLAISGLKFHDMNANGQKDADEPPIPGWDIQLKDGNDNLLQTATTSSEPGREGIYEFLDLQPGTYQVYEGQKTGWVRTVPQLEYYTVILTNMPSRGNIFGNNQLAISGMKFHDKNANSQKDADEPPISGWDIQLKDSSDNLLQTATTSSEPGREGIYEFVDLQPGTYRVYEVQRSGWVRTVPQLEYYTATLTNMPSRGNIFGNDFVKISGVKFEDLNGNAAKDAGEPGLEDWTIELRKEGQLIASTETAAGGAYSFDGISPGSYTVEEIVKSGWVQSYPASPGTHTVTLALGEAGPSDINFGNLRTTGFSGMKFEDLNGNGAKDSSEPGLAGWTIKLKKDGNEVASTQTAAGGAYSFAGIGPGSYMVEEEVLDGWTQSYPASPGTQAVTLVSGVPGPTDINFGNLRTTGFSGMKFEDRNGNGAKDSGEPGLADWTIKLKKDGTEIASTKTVAGGAYSFTGIMPGSYTVEEEVLDGWTQSYPASPGTQAVTLVSGVAGPTDINFGNLRTTGFSGMKFEDLNGNGAKDSDDPGLEGWTIKLKKEGTEVASTQTVAGGTYSFTGVAPGSYIVEEVVQDGWTQSYPASPGTHALTLVSGVAGPTDINFGNLRKTGFAGMKFEDMNGNGAKDSGEPGLVGWTIKLKKEGNEIASTQTAADGTYSFTGILPGSYTVEEVVDSGWTQSYPASPGTHTLTLVSGVAGPTDIDFGNFRSTGFAGLKFEDLNGNGARDSGEPGLEGWTIKLVRDGTEVASTQTAADGAYSFADIAPGSYTVEEVAQDGWTQTSPAGNVYTAVCSSGQIAITRADQLAVPSTEVNFGNRKLVAAFLVEITADQQTVLPGQDIVFTITINRQGDIQLNSLSAEYTLPKGLKFVSSNPSPQSVIENADGTTTLIWTGLAFSSLIAAQMAESQDASANPADAPAPSTIITVTTQVQPGAAESLTSTVVVTGSASEATIADARDQILLTVLSLSQPIYLNKTSDLKEVWPGATIGYTITYRSLARLTGVVITEQASPDLIFLSATPAPDLGTENVWSIGELPANEKGTINVLFQVKNASNLSFESQSSVSGSGFVNSYRRLSTETQTGGLKNSVTLTYDGQLAPVSTSYFVKLRDSEGTSLLKKEHGSGDFRSEEVAALQMQNRSISTEGSFKAVYRPTSFSLPGGKSINYDSEISSLTRTRNRATQASTSQEIRYAKGLEMDQKLLVDKNETLISVEGALQGQAHLGVLKKDGAAVKPSPVFESSQDFAGTFRFNQSLQDYGGNVRLIGNVSGLGQAASDQRLKKSQRSYEHGNGSYQSEELISTAESYMAKELSVSSDPQYGYGKWKSGIWSKSSGKSFLGQEISGADYIREETKASGLNDMSSNLSYHGQGRFRAVSEPDNRSMVDLDEEYVGEYSLQRKVHLGGVSRFDRPHLTLNKIGRLAPGTVVADYTINVLNDGNTALGPVYVWDIFPAGTDYLSSSLKPDRLQPGYANWSLLYLGIGQSVSISLRLNVTDRQEELVNVVYASGGYNGEWVTAGNMSVMQFGWLGCCQPDMLLEKQARIDAVDSRLIWYRILLQNRANVSLVAQVRDRLPAGLKILNASAEPQVQGQNLVWVTTAIPAGESRFIEYRAQAAQNGRFVNTAWAEAHALDGSGGAVESASATVTVGEATSYAEDGWRPPEWGLDRMEMICDDEIAGDGGSCSCPLSE